MRHRTLAACLAVSATLAAPAFAQTQQTQFDYAPFSNTIKDELIRMLGQIGVPLALVFSVFLGVGLVVGLFRMVIAK